MCGKFSQNRTSFHTEKRANNFSLKFLMDFIIRKNLFRAFKEYSSIQRVRSHRNDRPPDRITVPFGLSRNIILDLLQRFFLYHAAF